MNTPNCFPPMALLLLTGSTATAVTFVDVTPGNNSATITEVVLKANNEDQIQLAESGPFGSLPGPIPGSAAVLVQSVSISTGAGVNLNLFFFNTSGAAVVNVGSHITAANNIGVYDNGTVTLSKSNTSAYADALAKTAMDTDLRNYSFFDVVSPALPGAGSAADADLLFLRAVQTSDYFMVSERWGNTSFTVTALMENGQPYANANVLRLGGVPPSSPQTPTSDAYTRYDWNTGYSVEGDYEDQAQALTIFSAAEFFSDPTLTGPIFGLRIDNDGEADFKIVGISDNTFADNELNSRVVPEPSALVFALAGSFLWLRSRKRSA